MDYSIFKIVIGQVLRHFLSIAAGFLGAYGVTEGQQGELVEASIYIVIALIVFLGSQAWAYVSTRLAIDFNPFDEDAEV